MQFAIINSILMFFFSSAKDIKSKASNLLRRRHTEASFTDKSILPSREEISKWQTSFEHLLRHKCKIYSVFIFKRMVNVSKRATSN